MEYYRTDELYHHGIKGQRWGIRRYQNSDGTLTNAGRRRYSHMFDSKDTYERIKNIKNTDRIYRMSDRQRKSLDNAERYWKARAEGTEPTVKRGIIKRNSDRFRSYSWKSRAGQAAASTLLGSLGQLDAMIQTQGPVAALGSTAISTVVGAYGTVGISEIMNKAFGHF